MIADAVAWARSAVFDGVAAIVPLPRSGTLPASVIALHRNIHVLNLGDIGKRISVPPLRRGGKEFPAGPVVVLDDTVRSGKTIMRLRQQLGSRAACGRQILYAALYVRSSSRASVDLFGEIIPLHSVFAWNWQHVKEMRHYMLDMDGVLYPDQESARSGDARPLFVPSYPIRAIVTGRGLHLKDRTVRWLKHHGIGYRSLHMMPSDQAARREMGGVIEFKAAHYAADADARMFVESHREQARPIAARAGKPVLCTENWKLYS